MGLKLGAGSFPIEIENELSDVVCCNKSEMTPGVVEETDNKPEDICGEFDEAEKLETLLRVWSYNVETFSDFFVGEGVFNENGILEGETSLLAGDISESWEVGVCCFISVSICRASSSSLCWVWDGVLGVNVPNCPDRLGPPESCSPLSDENMVSVALARISSADDCALVLVVVIVVCVEDMEINKGFVVSLVVEESAVVSTAVGSFVVETDVVVDQVEAGVVNIFTGGIVFCIKETGVGTFMDVGIIPASGWFRRALADCSVVGWEVDIPETGFGMINRWWAFFFNVGFLAPPNIWRVLGSRMRFDWGAPGGKVNNRVPSLDITVFPELETFVCITESFWVVLDLEIFFLQPFVFTKKQNTFLFSIIKNRIHLNIFMC